MATKEKNCTTCIKPPTCPIWQNPRYALVLWESYCSDWEKETVMCPICGKTTHSSVLRSGVYYFCDSCKRYTFKR